MPQNNTSMQRLLEHYTAVSTQSIRVWCRSASYQSANINFGFKVWKFGRAIDSTIHYKFYMSEYVIITVRSNVYDCILNLTNTNNKRLTPSTKVYFQQHDDF